VGEVGVEGVGAVEGFGEQNFSEAIGLKVRGVSGRASPVV